MAGQLILSLSILIVLHELGHFLPAKAFKTRVEKFYLFFDPYFSLLKKKIGETEYGIGWLPLGGYVKISGMVDESMDTEQMNAPPQPWEFRSKPAWQRLIIMLGGVTVNAILGIVIYAAVAFSAGEKYLPASEMKYGIVADSLGIKMGLQTGDKIIGYDHRHLFETYSEIPAKIILDNVLSLQVERAGKTIDVPVTDATRKLWIDSKGEGIYYPAFPAVVGALMPDGAMAKAGGQPGDRIIALNGASLRFFDEVRIALRNLKNQQAVVTVLRGSDTLNLNAAIPATGLLGFSAPEMETFFTLKTVQYNLPQAIGKGFEKAGQTLGAVVKQFRVLFNPEMEGYKHLGGFMSIGKMYGGTWDWLRFWNMTGLLSIMLAFMNLLPIPALDGGHVMFTLYEIITGRKPSDKFLEYAQMVGMVILFSLLIFANGNDIYKAIVSLLNH